MASLLRRTVVLSFSRFANQAIVLISPMLLVRILAVGEYGAYREFLVYAALIGSFAAIGIRQSLLYFIPKYPEREQVWLTQTSLFFLATTTVAIIVIFVAGDLIRGKTSFDFVTALQLYTFFHLNLGFLETYWLSKKRTDYVLYYTALHLILKTATVVIVAYITEDARVVIYGLIIFEALRCLLVLCYASYRRLFSVRVSRESMGLQLSYVLPLGVGGIVEVVNNRAGMLFISAAIGPEALAFYATGAFAVQIVNILRGAIADVVFPEIMELRHAVPKDSLPLWKQASVWYCILLFPFAVLFSYYADAIVTVLFTADYATAIPVFATFAVMLILHSFDFHLPLRVQNANRYFFIGSIVMLVVNLALLYPMFQWFGLIGPAVAFVLSRLVFTLYLAYWTTSVYHARLREVAYWNSIGKVGAASLVCLPVLIAGKLMVENLLVRGVLFGGAYLVLYLWVLKILGIRDVFAMVRGMLVASRKSDSIPGQGS